MNKAPIIIGGLAAGGLLVFALTRKAKAEELPPGEGVNWRLGKLEGRK